MAETELNIVLRLIDNATAGIKKSVDQTKTKLEEFSEKTREAGIEMRKLGKEISQVGQTLTFFGAGVSAIFIKALNDSQKSSQDVSDAIKDLNAVSQDFQRMIAEAVVPVVRQLTAFLKGMQDALNSLSPELRDKILQFTFIASILSIVIGSVVFLVGKLIAFGGAIKIVVAATATWAAGNLVLIAQMALIAGAIAGVLFLMYKFKPVADTIVSTFEVVFLFLKNGFLGVHVALQKFTADALNSIAKILEGLASIPGPSSAALVKMAGDLRIAASNAQVLVDRGLKGIEDSSVRIGNILTSGQGQWSNVFQEMKVGAEQVAEAIGKIGSTDIALPENQSKLIALQEENAIRVQMTNEIEQLEREVNNRTLLDWIKTQNAKKQLLLDLKKAATMTSREIAESFSSSLGRLGAAFAQASALSKGFAKAQQAIAIAQAIINTAVAVTKARSSAPPPFNYVLAAIEAAAGAVQIATIASQKFHQGGIVGAPSNLASDEIPIIAQSGEGILSRKGVQAAGGEQGVNRLNQGQGAGGDVNFEININYPKMTSKDDVIALSGLLGEEIQRQLRYARGR